MFSPIGLSTSFHSRSPIALIPSCQIHFLAKVFTTQSTQKTSHTALFMVADVFVTQCHTLFTESTEIEH